MSGVYLHLLFAFGGGLGAVLRHWSARRITHDLPLATLAVNVAGTLLLGLWLGHLETTGASVSEDARRLVLGFCGGLTTFSSFAWQTLDLHRSRTILIAAGNILISVVLCALAYLLGQYLTG